MTEKLCDTDLERITMSIIVSERLCVLTTRYKELGKLENIPKNEYIQRVKINCKKDFRERNGLLPSRLRMTTKSMYVR